MRSSSEADRRRGVRFVAGGFAAVVGVSAGTTALFSGATLVEAGLVAVLGLLVGVVLARFVVTW